MPTIAEIRQQYPQYNDMSDGDLASALHAKFYHDMPRTEFDKKIGMESKPKFNWSDAVTDIPNEIGRTAQANLDTIKTGITDRSQKGPIEGLMDTGKAALAVPGLLASPITGAVRSLVGHPMAQLEHKIGEVIAPDIAAKDDPQKMYENAAGDAEKAMLAARPMGGTPRGFAGTPLPPEVPSVQELKSTARSQYHDPTVEAVEIKPQSVGNLSTQIENSLLKEGYRPHAGQGSGAFREVQGLAPGNGVSSVKVADIDSARKGLGVLGKERDVYGDPTAEASAAQHAIEHINNYLPSLTQGDLIAGDAAGAANILDQARSNWGAAKRAQQVELLLNKADRQAARSGSGSNIENARRQKIAQILDNPKKSVGYSPDEIGAMDQIVEGTPTRNALRKVGRLGVSDGLSLLLHGGTALTTHGLNLPIAVGGTVARKIGEALTASEGRKLSEMIRSRSALRQGQGQGQVGNMSTPGLRSLLAQALLSEGPRSHLQIPRLGMPANASENKQ